MGLVYKYSKADDKNEDFHIALLADTHVKAYKNEQYRGFFPFKNLQIVVDQVRQKATELLLINGDVARLDGQLGDYVAIKDILSPLTNAPIVMTLGNHDDRGNFYNVYDEKTNNKQTR